MEVYIEKDVIEKLNEDFQNENLFLGQQKLRDILQFYSEIEFCTNFSFDKQEFENYKFKNPLFNKIVENAIVKSFTCINEFINKSILKQTIVIELKEDVKNKELVNVKGGLYFTYDDYSKKIEEIIKNYQKRVDLSERFNGWESIVKSSSLKLNEIIISDKYLLDKIENIDRFIMPLIRSVKRQSNLNRIIFMTDYLNKINFNLENKEKQLNDILKTVVKICHYNIRDFSNHDRILYTNFFMIDCPIGFNQTNKISDSMITIETIFDKFTYERKKRHYRNINQLLL